jgi:hypothetical protein
MYVLFDFNMQKFKSLIGKVEHLKPRSTAQNHDLS